jgi:hypothetical protein
MMRWPIAMSPRAARIARRLVLAVVILAVAAVAGFTYMIGGPRNLIGMLRYDQREEGNLRVGDRAPDVVLTALDGTTRSPLLADRGDQALVLVFGSFT